MLARQVLEDDRAGPDDLYEAVRYLVNQAILTGRQAVQGRLGVTPSRDRAGWVELRARVGNGRAASGATSSFWVPLAAMDELNLTKATFQAALPRSLEDAVSRARAKAPV